jgi:hypothetical protein
VLPRAFNYESLLTKIDSLKLSQWGRYLNWERSMADNEQMDHDAVYRNFVKALRARNKTGSQRKAMAAADPVLGPIASKLTANDFSVLSQVALKQKKTTNCNQY